MGLPNPNTNSVSVGLNHILKHHRDSKGYIAIFHKSKNANHRQYHYKTDEIKDALGKWYQDTSGENLYFSQNTFWKPYRRIENLKELRALYIDIDCYKLGYDPQWVLASLELNYFKEKIPDPNEVIMSGQGLVLVWWLAPTPSNALPLWQVLQNRFFSILKDYGADPMAKDASRVLRIDHTVNQKNGAIVEVQYRHEDFYVLRDLEREYLPVLSLNRGPKANKRRKSKSLKVHHKLYSLHSLFYTRLLDLVKICELRNYQMTGYRELTLFLYRYWSCCFLTDPEEALRNTLELNDSFSLPLPKNEVISATRSAEKAFLNSNGKYKYSNPKIIELLDITPEEQRYLATIIAEEEKQRRNTVYQRNKRRNAGAIDRQKQSGERHEEVIKLKKEGLTQKAIAERLKINQSQVSRLLKNSSI